MRRKTWVILALIVLCIALAAYFLLQRQAAPPPLAQKIVPPAIVSAPPAPPPAAVAAEPAIVHPLVTTPPDEPLPELEQSDATIIKALLGVLGQPWQDLLIPDALIHNIVAFVDNLPRAYLPAKIVPLARVPGAFITSGQGNELAIGTLNRERYAAYIARLEAVDSARLVALYRQFYPLFQRAYVELGYPQAYFNDRLIEAIDDLLAAPALDEPIRLVQPKVLYQFADAPTEARSAGQKIMMRMGGENAARLKTKLRGIRQQVAHQPAGAASRP